MKIYVWRGDRVLENYNTGLIVVAASSLEEAYTKLKEANIQAFYRLKYGINSWINSKDEEVFFITEKDFQYQHDWIAPTPEVYTMDTLPVLVIAGGE